MSCRNDILMRRNDALAIRFGAIVQHSQSLLNVRVLNVCVIM